MIGLPSDARHGSTPGAFPNRGTVSNRPNHKRIRPPFRYAKPTDEQQRMIVQAFYSSRALGCTCVPSPGFKIHREAWLKVLHDDDCPLRNAGTVYVADSTGRAS